LRLTPIQSWFFELDLAEPWHFNQAQLLVLRQPVRPGVLRRAFGVLVEHHEALRQRFVRENGQVKPRAAAKGGEVPFVQVDLACLGGGTATARRSAANRVQASLDLENGPLLRAVLFTGSEASSLLLVVHHLAIDTVSWHILLNDLERICEALENDRPPDLPNPSMPYREWAERLSEHVDTEAVRGELPYWLALPRRVPALPGAAADRGLRGTVARVSIALSAARTDDLLRRVPAAYHTRINDVLLTALARSTARWTGGTAVLVELESHGREDVLPEVDLSQTVGWFTTAYPVLLRLPPAGPGESLVAVKEQLRAVPRHGFGYFLMRTLGDGELRSKLAEAAEPEISFNYFGQLDGLATPRFDLRPDDPEAGRRHSPRGRNLIALEIDGGVSDGRLGIQWHFSPDRFHPSTVEGLARSFQEELEGLITHCLTPGVGGRTASDFPLAGLTTAELQALGNDPPVEDVYPLTPVQEGLAFHALYDPSSEVYFEQSCWALRGALDPGAFRGAWEWLHERHAALRTAFVTTAGGVRQVVRRTVDGTVELPFEEHDWRTADPADQDSRLRRFLTEDRRQGFDLATPPLWRVCLIRLGQASYRFVWSTHHILLDGW
jgi:non-ribosomal peptide synthase protein (TIGR01720 family)